MFFVIIPVSCLLAFVLAKDAIKAKEFVMEEDSLDDF
jgi:hypothetical protein